MEYLEVYQDEGINMYVDIGDSDTKITEKSVEDGIPLEGARVTLQCTDPPGGEPSRRICVWT